MKKNYKLSAKQIRCYGAYLREQERADSTVQKYLHDLAALLAYLRGRALTKAVLLEWKGDLAGRYAPASVNTMLAAVNGFLRFMGWGELTVRFLKIQKALFCDERRELTRADYVRLVNTARAIHPPRARTDTVRVRPPGKRSRPQWEPPIIPGAPDHLRHRNSGL